jgi:hypothetical protein
MYFTFTVCLELGPVFCRYSIAAWLASTTLQREEKTCARVKFRSDVLPRAIFVVGSGSESVMNLIKEKAANASIRMSALCESQWNSGSKQWLSVAPDILRGEMGGCHHLWQDTKPPLRET